MGQFFCIYTLQLHRRNSSGKV